MRVLGYVRTSTEEQAISGQSVDVQKSKIKAYCELYDLELVETYIEAGASGKSLKRPMLTAALAALEDKTADGIVIAKLDRLTRSIADWQFLITHYFSEKTGYQLFSVSDSIDTRSASGRLVLNVLLSVAQWERETIGERTRDALQIKRSKGERCGKLKYGYDLAADGKTLIWNEVEQTWIETMHCWRAEGYSYRDISRKLNYLGITTKDGKSWQHTSVKTVLERKD